MMWLKRSILVVCGLLLFAGTALWAQPPAPGDPLAEHLFPPELVMQHQQAIGLSEDQRSMVKAEILRAQTRFTELQWQLQSEMETLASLVRHGRIDEQRTLAQLDRILGHEREIKRTHLALVIRIKNVLSPEQQARLQTIKRGLQGR